MCLPKHTNLQNNDTRLEFLTPAPHVVHVTKIMYGAAVFKQTGDTTYQCVDYRTVFNQEQNAYMRHSVPEICLWW